MAEDLGNSGLCVGSEVSDLVDRFGLRSSSESERLMGNIGPPRGALEFEPMCFPDDRSGVVGENLAPGLGVGNPLSVDHEGTGGRPSPGDIASFLWA